MRITRAPEMLIRTIFNLSYPMIKTPHIHKGPPQEQVEKENQ